MPLTRLPATSITGTIGSTNLPTVPLTKFPTGSIIQTVTGKYDASGGSTTSTSFVEMNSGFRPKITPTRANSKIQGYIFTNCTDDIDNDSQGQPNSGFKITYTIDSTETTMFDRSTAFCKGGHDRRTGFHSTVDLTVSSTDEILFKIFYKKISGDRSRQFNSFRLSHFILHEIAQ